MINHIFKLIPLLAAFLTSEVFATICSINTPQSSIYALSAPELDIEKLFYACKTPESSDKFKNDLVLSGTRFLSPEKNKKIRAFLQNNTDSLYLEKFDYLSTIKSYTAKDIFKNIDEIMKISPEYIISQMHLFDTEQDVYNVLELLDSGYSEDQRQEALSELFQYNYQMNEKIIASIQNKGLNLSYNDNTKSQLCEIANSHEQYYDEIMSEEFPQMTYADVIERIKSDTEDFFSELGDYVDTRTFMCGSQTLDEMMKDMKDPDYWNLEHMDIIMPLPPKVSTKLVALQGNEKLFKFKDKNYLIAIGIPTSCKLSSKFMDHLAGVIHNLGIAAEGYIEERHRTDFTIINYEPIQTCHVRINLSPTALSTSNNIETLLKERLPNTKWSSPLSSGFFK